MSHENADVLELVTGRWAATADEFDFSDHPPQGARCLDKPERIGFDDHTYLAVTIEGLPLGVVGGGQFDRSPDSLGKSVQCKHLPIEKKESFRWLTGHRRACELAREFPEKHVISASDSEADIYDIYREAQTLGQATDLIIRAKENRCTPELNLAAGLVYYDQGSSAHIASLTEADHVIDRSPGRLQQSSQRAAARRAGNLERPATYDRLLDRLARICKTFRRTCV